MPVMDPMEGKELVHILGLGEILSTVKFIGFLSFKL